MKLVQTSEHLARIRAILAAPGFSVRTVPLRPRLLEFETGADFMSAYAKIQNKIQGDIDKYLSFGE